MSCAKCDKKFTAGAILTALEKKWHPECFVCVHCRAQLANQMFHCKEDVPFCAKCWRNLHAPKCDGCKSVIETNEQYLNYNEKSYHKTCFVCAHCKESLGGKQFCIKDDQYFCTDHV